MTSSDLTLRDYFAAHAVSGILAQMTISQTESGYPDGDPAWNIASGRDCSLFAEGAYRVAQTRCWPREKRW
jgi:hypothetical protein